MSDELLKEQAAKAVIALIDDDMTVGVGTGSTVNYFIDALASVKHIINAAVASSEATAQRLKAHAIPVVDLNAAGDIDIYVDGADEVNEQKLMIKGGGGALTREKLVSQVAKEFVCIVHSEKRVKLLGKFPIAVEVLPMARSYVAREIVKLGGDPEYRDGFVTDNGNIIIDVYDLDLTQPLLMEERLKQITGVVESGLFAKRTADKVIVATKEGITRY